MSDPGYWLLGVQYVRRQAKQLAQQLDGVRAADDIEFVHRARVATRRLRAALRMFADCFPAKRLRRWTRAIRRTTAQLGDARDRDVQTEYLCTLLSAATEMECLPGIARLLVHLDRDRECMQPKVVKTVDRLEGTGVLRDMRRSAKRVLREAATNADAMQSHKWRLTPFSRHVFRELDELIRQENSLTDPDDQQGHHTMRIAAKRLRYTLEIARPMYSGRLDSALEAIKKVQSLLGDMHDCDVWAGQLDAFALQECKRLAKRFGRASRMSRLQPGIDYVRQDRRRHRDEAFAQLVAFWAELGGRRLWDSLREALADDRSPPAATSQNPAGTSGSAIVPTSDIPASTVSRESAASRPGQVDGDPKQPPPTREASEHGRQRPLEPLLTVGS